MAWGRGGGRDQSANQGANQGQGDVDYNEQVVLDTRPCYVKYSLRGLGTFAGALCLVFGILNLIFHLLTFWCVLFSIVQAVIGFIVATTEAAGGTVRICYCIFLNRFPKCSDFLDRQPLWVKPIAYILAPLPGMLACTTWWTVFGGGFVLFTGIAYAISLWKQEPPAPKNNAQIPTTQNSTPTTFNNSPVSSQPTATPTANVLFPKHTVNVNSNSSNRNSTSPTIIDIRQNNASTFANSTSGSKSPMNPLAKSLSNYDSGTASGGGNSTSSRNYDEESGGWNGGRYENISTISGNNNTGMELGPPKNTNSFYSNVDLDEGGSSGGPIGGGPTFSTSSDNPFVHDSRRNNVVTIGRNQRQRGHNNDDDEDEHNC